MLNVILASKKNMGQTWDSEGRRLPTTRVQAGPVVVTQIKTKEKNGYEAVQLGFGEKKIKNITKPVLGHLKKVQKSNIKNQNDNVEFKTDKFAPRFLREVKNQQPTTHNPAEGEAPASQRDERQGQQLPKIGDVIKASDVLAPGDLVKVVGTSKGKGFAGGVKRWGFHGGPRTHGQSDRERAPGSIGATTTPGRVMKGKKMAGRMGHSRVTVKNLTVLGVSQDGTVLLSGPVPGSLGSLLIIEKIGHNDKFKTMEKEEQMAPVEEENPATQGIESENTETIEEKEEKTE